MKTIRRRRLIIFIGVLLTVGGILVGGALANAVIPSYPQNEDVIAVSVLPTGSSPAMKLTDQDLSNISDTLKSPVAWWGILRGQVSTEFRSVQADVYAIGGSYTRFHPVTMLQGSFLPDSNAPNNAVVLDKGLAWQLFGTLNVVGMEADLQGKKYSVTGVCDTDTSLPGLLSGNGIGAAYIPYNDLDPIPVAGMEAALPKAVTGKSLQSVKNAFGTQGKAVSSFLFTDITERSLMDIETSGLPLAAMASILTILIIFLTIRIAAGMGWETWRFARDSYFREAWKLVLWRVSKILLVCIVASGLVYTLWSLAGFRFYLPTRYIPASWIDLDFYKSLIQSEAQAANTALAYLPAPWDIAHEKAILLSNWMNAMALAGMAVFALGLRLLKDTRDAETVETRAQGWKSGANDLLSLWIYIITAAGIGVLINTILGISIYLPIGTAVLLGLGLSLWAARRLYNKEIIRLFCKNGSKVHAIQSEEIPKNEGA